MMLEAYIKPELLILIPVLSVLRTMFIRAKMRMKLIQLLVPLIGVILSTTWVFSTTETATFGAIFQGLFIGITQGILLTGIEQRILKIESKPIDLTNKQETQNLVQYQSEDYSLADDEQYTAPDKVHIYNRNLNTDVSDQSTK